MPTKNWEEPRVEQDRRREPAARYTDQPRSFDASTGVDDVNTDTPPRTDADEDINTHGSER